MHRIAVAAVPPLNTCDLAIPGLIFGGVEVDDAETVMVTGRAGREDVPTVVLDVAKLRVGEPAELQRMLRAFHEIKAVRRTRTMMVLDTSIDRSPTISLHGRSE